MSNSEMGRRRPAGITALAGLFAFGTLMSGLAAAALSMPGGFLEAMWRVNPSARAGFTTMGPWAIALMIVVCIGCGVAAYGLWKLRSWGQIVAITVLGINIMGDTGNALIRHDYRTVIGILIGGLMIWYLVRQRSVFITA
jgi:hypothetical protein